MQSKENTQNELQKQKGLFIVFEGIDNSGKSTQAKLAIDYFKSLGREIVSEGLPREPGGTKLGEELRRILKSNEYKGEISGESEVFLFCAARKEYMDRLVLPAINSGKDFISDRYKYSTEAFQGARGVDRKLIQICNDYSTQSIEPNLVVLIDRDAKDAFNSKPQSERDRFEQDLKYMEKVREIYLDSAQKNLHVKIVKHIHGDIDGMFRQVKQYLDSLTKNRFD